MDNISGELDVVVGKLANLGVIDTQDFGVVAGAKLTARNEVDEEQDDAGAEERVCEARHRVRKLVAELDVVVVEPAASDDAEAVEMRDVVTVERN